MKHALLLALALLPLLAAPLRAAVDSPNFVDYQGMVFDSTTGAPLGSAGTAPNFTAAAKNYTMQFRIFGSQAGTDLIYAESQTVTVTLGAFSVRLGSGAPIAGLIPPPTKGVIQDAFDGADRFLELTVFPTGASIGTPITPRLKFQSAPFAFIAKRAAVADEVIGKVTATTGSTFAGTINATGATFTGATYQGNGAGLTDLTAAQIPALPASKITSGVLAAAQIPNLDANKITTGTLGDTRLSPNVALLNRTPQAFAGINTFAGRVGIGTTTPNAPLHVVGNSSQTFLLEALLTTYGAADTSIGAHIAPVGIEVANAVKAQYFAVLSDERIKDIVGQSKSAEDLDTLLDIEVTDYRYKDKLTCGSKVIKKVIAQQVEKVFPASISRSTGVIPDIYQQAKVEDGWIQMESDLKVGERVRLISKTADEVVAVTETREGGFRTASKPSGEKVFVYGREVDDFRAVDYEAIAMLNVSATQQIKKELDAVKAENESLRALVKQLAERDEVRETRLIAVEKLLATPAQAAVRSVSLNTAAAH